jgi:predicted O-methyltransferase YrrM
MPGFTARLESLDTEVFRAIPSETSDEDRRSLLALHLACRASRSKFRWLEIGSHLGGSLQALVRDPACAAIDSIDLRPERLPDERLSVIEYPDNSTERMRRLLSDLPGSDIRKLRCHEADTGQLDPEAFEHPDVCFIDGEHTDEACGRDAEFCRRVLRDNGLIAFHDVDVIYQAVAAFVESLRTAGIAYRLAYLPDVIFAIELGESDLLRYPEVVNRQLGAGAGVLQMLCTNGRYRAILKGRRARLLRKLGLLRVSEPIVAPGRGPSPGLPRRFRSYS